MRSRTFELPVHDVRPLSPRKLGERLGGYFLSSLVNFNMLLLSETSSVCVWLMVDSEKKCIKFKRILKIYQADRFIEFILEAEEFYYLVVIKCPLR